MMRGRWLRHGERRREQVYEAAGIGPEDIDVVELHDCFAHNELITYEALGLCPRAEREVHRRRRQYLWRQSRHQSLRRAAVEGASARRDRPRAMLRADPAVARHRRRDARSMARGWRCSTISAWAAPASSRCTSAHEARHGRSIRRRASLYAGHRACRARTGCATSSTRSASAIRSIAMTQAARAAGLCGDPGAADLSVLP